MMNYSLKYLIVLCRRTFPIVGEVVGDEGRGYQTAGRTGY